VSKNRILLIVSTIFLVVSIFFALSQKRSFNTSLANLKEEYIQIQHTAKLKELWSAKGIKSKLTKISTLVDNSKKERFLLKRNKADIAFKSLNEKELNKLLSKLAMLPLQFKKLMVERGGDNFKLECLCVW